MARPRTPLAKAVATGRVSHDPKRFKDRREPISDRPLGPPPTWLDRHGRAAWRTFDHEIGWLNYSHRALVGIAATLRARQMTSLEPNTKELNLLRMCLNSMGATPADARKVGLSEPEANVDPATKYF